jgi:hypothetical protein
MTKQASSIHMEGEVEAGVGVFVLRDENTLVPMQVAKFASENDFQRLLTDFPALLAGDQMDRDNPRRFLQISREQGIASEEGGALRWSLDHLFLDQDGIPTLVEVKRGTDSRIRREVVGHMLDYAANCIVYWPVEELRARFETRCAEDDEDSAQAFVNFLGPDHDIEAFWALVRTNLQAGKVRMLFVADRIPAELRRIVEFLNGQMQPAEVLAVEIRQYEGQGLKTLVPVVIGQSQGALQKKGTAGSAASKEKRLWDEATILEALQRKGLGPEVVEAARRICDWTRGHGDKLYFSTSPTWGGMGPWLGKGAEEFYPFLVHTDGTVGIYFQYMLTKPIVGDESFRRELLHRLNEIDGVALPADSLSKRPGISLKVLAKGENTARFLEVMGLFVGEWRRRTAEKSQESSGVEERLPPPS